jgi:hypothetical protein
MCCGKASVSANSQLAICWMDFQPLPKGGDACLWAGVFAVRALPGGAGGLQRQFRCVFAT